jgi:hypothetical protein
MRVLKELDLSAEEAQLRLVMALKKKNDPDYPGALDRLHRMLAEKTLAYYCPDGYDAFFERHRLDYETEDGYAVTVRGHDMSVSIKTPAGSITGRGSTWDYTSGDLEVSPKPPEMDKKRYADIKRRMAEIQDDERVLYPFHPLHRIGNGYFDTKMCMYGAHKLIREGGQK